MSYMKFLFVFTQLEAAIVRE